MRTMTRQLSVWLFAAATLAASQLGWAIVVGPNPGGGGDPNPENILPFVGPVYQALPSLGDAPNYTLPDTVIDLSVTGPYWLKRFAADDGDGTPDAGDRPVIGIGDYLLIKETLTVGGLEPWTNWHETIIVEGWSWINGAVYVGGTNTLVDGFMLQLAKSNAADPHFDITNFYFDELAPGATIDIVKILQFQGFNTPSPNDNWGSDPVSIREFPTQMAPPPVIPEPATIGLLALGSTLFGFVRRRRQ